MKKFHATTLTALFAIALLALIPATAAFAATGDMDGDHVALTGQLSQGEQGEYILIEQQSGDAVVLEGSDKLSEHVGQTVKVTGKWTEDGTFEVTKCESASATSR